MTNIHLTRYLFDSLYLGSAFKFQGNPPVASDIPHIFVALGKMGDVLLCVHATSQVDLWEKRILGAYGANIEPRTTYRIYEPDESSVLWKRSLIDCTRVHEVPFSVFANGFIELLPNDFEPSLVQDLAAAARKSLFNSARVKRLVGTPF